MIFNYDLPWNPMRVEQRIGRIDRYGQTSEKVRIFSFFLKGTIEERILERLYTRIGIFEESVGDLEPILGPIAAELTREVFASDLSPDEEAALAERYATMVASRRYAERELEEKGRELLGQDVLLMQEVGNTVQSGRYVSPDELRAVVSGYLNDVIGTQIIDRVHDGTVLVPGDGRLRSRVDSWISKERDYRPASTSFAARSASTVGVPGTFTGELAHQRPKLEFFNLRHPLVRMAVDHYQALGMGTAYPTACFRVDPNQFDQGAAPWPGVGTYRFVLFLLEVSGAQKQLRLVPIVFDDAGHRAELVEGRLLHLIQGPATGDPAATMDTRERDELETLAGRAIAVIADQVEADAVTRNAGSIAVRRATLERTYNHRIRKRQELLAAASDDRIRRLRTGEISNLQRELVYKVADLESKRSVAVQRSTIGAGRLVIAVPEPVAGSIGGGRLDTGRSHPDGFVP